MSMVDRLFLDHPASVGETYSQHLAVAWGFGARLTLAGLACLIHGLIPGLFPHAASDQIRALGREMESRRLTGPGLHAGSSALDEQNFGLSRRAPI